MDEQTIQQDLESGIEDEDLHEDSKAAVFAANAGFYPALRNSDLLSIQSM